MTGTGTGVITASPQWRGPWCRLLRPLQLRRFRVRRPHPSAAQAVCAAWLRLRVGAPLRVRLPLLPRRFGLLLLNILEPERLAPSSSRALRAAYGRGYVLCGLPRRCRLRRLSAMAAAGGDTEEGDGVQPRIIAIDDEEAQRAWWPTRCSGWQDRMEECAP